VFKKVLAVSILSGLLLTSATVQAGSDTSVVEVQQGINFNKVIRTQATQLSLKFERELDKDMARNKARLEATNQSAPNPAAIWLVVGGLFCFVMRVTRGRV